MNRVDIWGQSEVHDYRISVKIDYVLLKVDCEVAAWQAEAGETFGPQKETEASTATSSNTSPPPGAPPPRPAVSQRGKKRGVGPSSIPAKR